MKETVRLDYRIISGIIAPDSKVLDLGCGGGELIDYLKRTKNANVQGIELDEDEIYKCVARGLSVFHGDIDDGLKSYPDKSFDYVILNQSLQEMLKIDYVIDEALRVGKKVIIGFPNFAHISAKWRPKFEFDKKIALEMFNFGKFLFLGGIVWFLKMAQDN